MLQALVLWQFICPTCSSYHSVSKPHPSSKYKEHDWSKWLHPTEQANATKGRQKHKEVSGRAALIGVKCRCGAGVWDLTDGPTNLLFNARANIWPANYQHLIVPCVGKDYVKQKLPGCWATLRVEFVRSGPYTCTRDTLLIPILIYCLLIDWFADIGRVSLTLLWCYYRSNSDQDHKFHPKEIKCTGRSFGDSRIISHCQYSYITYLTMN